MPDSERDGGCDMGLRERKRARTRALIADSAMTLFAQRGFDRVTVADVAATAELAVTTVFNYFPTKEDLFFDRQDEVVGHLGLVIRSRHSGESFASACRRDMLELIDARDWRIGLGPGMAEFYRMVDASPALQARSRLLADQAATELTAVLADELPAGHDEILATTTACILSGIHFCLIEQVRRQLLAGTGLTAVVESLVAATNQAFDLLDGRLGRLGAGPAQ